eukprot:NODE_50_length_27150_cov_0.307308.p18 type:complete len:107 gc:universal NODE_50_length_27150_cov_0.307308:13055-12735(-)
MYLLHKNLGGLVKLVDSVNPLFIIHGYVFYVFGLCLLPVRGLEWCACHLILQCDNAGHCALDFHLLRQAGDYLPIGSGSAIDIIATEDLVTFIYTTCLRTGDGNLH